MRHQKYQFMRVLLAFLLFAFFCAFSFAQNKQPWTGSWSSAQMSECDTHQLPASGFDHTTLRQTIHLSLGGDRIRLRLSNLFGDQRLQISSVTVAPALKGKLGAITPGSALPVLFKGSTSVKIPSESELVSDPVALRVAPLSDLVVSIAIDKAPACVTTHPGSRATSLLVAGNRATDAEFNTASSVAHWYFLSAVEVENNQARGAIVAFGDSITDGHGATTDKNDRWTDVLARRLAPEKIAVLNLGIGGNCILHTCLGPSALERFERDALGATNVHAILFFEGVNDLGGLDRTESHPQDEHDKRVAKLETAMRDLAEKSHRKGLCILGATITPYADSDYYHPSQRSEADRVKLNNWIRTSGVFDGVVDFDTLVLDPARPDHLSRTADSGDHLHPGPEGYRIMGEGFPLSLLASESCRRQN